MATKISVTGRDSDKFMLRFPDGMRDRIAEAAKANNRSMNAEIVARLETSFAPRSDIDDAMLALLKVTLSLSSRFIRDKDVLSAVKKVTRIAEGDLSEETIREANSAFDHLLGVVHGHMDARGIPRSR